VDEVGGRTPAGGGADAGIAGLLGRVDRALGRALPGLERATGEVAEPATGRGWVRCVLLQPSGDDLATLPVFVAEPHLSRIRQGVAPSSLEELLTPGRTVTVAGRVRRAPRSGRIELRAERVDAVAGEGLLAYRRRAAEERLRADGLLETQRLERQLPLAPLRVALVGGWDSDGLADARRVLADSGYRVACRPYQERVEGPGAAARIARAVRRAAADANQAVLLVRGGGSGMALSPFDAEPVARAIAQAPVPVLTGIGHQRNHTLADAVAHRACITPTGAAEQVVRRLRQAEARLRQAAGGALDAAAAAQRHRRRLRQRAGGLALLALLAATVAATTGRHLPLALAALTAVAAALAAPPCAWSAVSLPATPPADVEQLIVTLDRLAADLRANPAARTPPGLRGQVLALREHGLTLLRGRPSLADAAARHAAGRPGVG
jgi:Exonuclease VII, large subunit